MDIVHHRTCTYQIRYHIVFCTKYRYKMLVGTVSEDLKRILTDVAKEKGFDIREMAVGEDHVHLIIKAPPHISISSLVKWVKGISARHMFMKRPGLKKKLYKFLRRCFIPELTDTHSWKFRFKITQKILSTAVVPC